MSRALFRKAINDAGYTIKSESDASLLIYSLDTGAELILSFDNEVRLSLVQDSSLSFTVPMDGLTVTSPEQLYTLLKSGNLLVLPSATQLTEILNKQFEALPTTERTIETKQRIGQDIYRKALLSYWGGRCAVTGIEVPELLRASHAKPWKDATDIERLDVFNGLLLAVHLDALFDSGLLWFDESGVGYLSDRIDAFTADQLRLIHPLKLRNICEHHQPYLQYHRKEVAKLGSN